MINKIEECAISKALNFFKEDLEKNYRILFESKKNNFYLTKLKNNSYLLEDDKDYYQYFIESLDFNDLIEITANFFKEEKIKILSIQTI